MAAKVSASSRPRPRRTRLAALLAGVVVLAGLGWTGGEIAYRAWAVRADVAALQSLASARDLKTLASAGPEIAAARHHVEALQAAVAPVLWLTPGLRWVPVYGADLASAGPLLELARGMLTSADDVYAALSPLIPSVAGNGAAPTPANLIAALVAARPQLEVASAAAAEAATARAELAPETLSPRARRLIGSADTLLPWLRRGPVLALAAPDLLGSAGPRTYLLLIQNEDELRATGGFISAVGTLTVARGQIQALQIDDYTAVDDFSLHYPLPPEPLQRYMGASLWLLRDANWSPDFPSSAAFAGALYTAARRQPVDGVVAVNQAALQLVLRAIGPLTLAGTPEPVSADNVVAYMRAAWSPSPGQGVTGEWWQHRKDFMRSLAAAILDRLPAVSPMALAQAARQALDERQILVWLKDPQAAAILAELGWDGALERGEGDYLMVVDSNLGFNKVNAIAQTELDYAVDLSTPAAPAATLSVTHFNPAQGALPCRQWITYSAGNLASYTDLIQRCYWDYLRVYTPAGATLTSAATQNVPGQWMLSGRDVTGTVTTGLEKDQLQSFGTLVVTPFETTQVTTFTYQLPPQILTATASGWAYTLRIQKQSGTLAVPVRLAVEFPTGARVVSSEPAGIIQGNHWRLEAQLTQDVTVRLVFQAR